jgi:hypothetical protein
VTGPSRPGPVSEEANCAEAADALVAALVDLERHVGGAGWDAPPRLFALVPTDALVAAEPELAARLGLRSTAGGGMPGALTAVEQDDFTASGDLLADLEAVAWPPTVLGCAVSAVRTFLPADAEGLLPADHDEAAAFVGNHPDRQDVRVVVGVDRHGHRHGVARLASQPDELLAADDLVPGLTAVLAHTLI